jgi:hypothetical protein
MGQEPNLPEIAGTKNGVLLVIGAARCVFDDLARFQSRFPVGDHDTMVCNHMGAYYPVFQHWASPYPDHAEVWEDCRKTVGLAPLPFLGHT